jgi:hypothetical protein
MEINDLREFRRSLASAKESFSIQPLAFSLFFGPYFKEQGA